MSWRRSVHQRVLCSQPGTVRWVVFFTDESSFRQSGNALENFLLPTETSSMVTIGWGAIALDSCTMVKQRYPDPWTDRCCSRLSGPSGASVCPASCPALSCMNYENLSYDLYWPMCGLYGVMHKHPLCWLMWTNNKTHEYRKEQLLNSCPLWEIIWGLIKGMSTCCRT